MSEVTAFDITADLPGAGETVLLEASAGTGSCRPRGRRRAR